jgi:hypothetical protein
MHRALFLAMLAVTVALAVPSAGAAQRLPERLQSFRPAAADSGRKFAPTYWFEGATIGAALVGTTTVIIAASFCAYGEGGSCRSTTYIGSAVVGGVIGAGLGGLAGGMFAAPHERPLRGQPGRAALLGAVGGAVWSVGILCHSVARCSGRGEASFGLSMSFVGALAGLIVGL